MSNCIILKSFFLSALFLLSCASYGDIQRSYENNTREEIWIAMQEVVIQEFQDIEQVLDDPPSIVTALKTIDKEFGLDKTQYRAYLKLTGFNRPYFIQIVVKNFPNGEEQKRFTYDFKYAERILNLIDERIRRNRGKNIFEKYKPM